MMVLMRTAAAMTMACGWVMVGLALAGAPAATPPWLVATLLIINSIQGWQLASGFRA